LRALLRICALAVAPLISACAENPKSELPPSASDVVLMKSIKLCDAKARILDRYAAGGIHREPWGAGEELRVPAAAAESGTDESFFFEQDGPLVGAVFSYPKGLPLKPYPILRKTLAELNPKMEFYLKGFAGSDTSAFESSALYATGDETTTTQYVTRGQDRNAVLLLASRAIDTYADLMSPYRPEFLARVGGSRGDAAPAGSKANGAAAFTALQQFARGQTAQLGYCGAQNYERAVDAYRKTLELGVADKNMLGEVHHKLGVSLEKIGKLKEAETEILQSLTIRPNMPDVINNLGDLYVKMGERGKATAAFERAVTLRPNYPLARFNLAGMYEDANPKRAISEYETYLALVEGVPEEADREAKAKARVKALRGK
jgi:tetratricopeptide (TPR) repeat protein